jgi:transcriptional regulator
VYCPQAFAQTDESALYQLMRDYPFATFLTYSQDELQVDHLPLLLEQENGVATLWGHLAAANSTAKLLREDDLVMIVFNGPQAYVSPNWYPTKQENGKAVPTWNYMVVHVKGRIKLIHDQSRLRTLLEKLTREHESELPHPWKISDAPEDFIEKNLRAIVGFEVRIESIQGKWKLNQNHPEKNQRGVMEAYLAFKDEHHQRMASLIQNRLITEGQES